MAVGDLRFCDRKDLALFFVVRGGIRGVESTHMMYQAL